MLLLVIKLLVCLLLSFILTALSEVLYHKWLFHGSGRYSKYLTGLWNYDPTTHKHHHIVCRSRMEDKIDSDSSYWVQRPSNVAVAGFIAFAVQALILFISGAHQYWYLISMVSIATFFTIWYKFEDHFHLAMHKKHYYQSHIKNTWKDSWFQYTKRLHTIHHRDPSVNYGFIFFPVGDLLIGTYAHTYRHLSNLEKKRLKKKC